jgi:hypothetical protein
MIAQSGAASTLSLGEALLSLKNSQASDETTIQALEAVYRHFESDEASVAVVASMDEKSIERLMEDSRILPHCVKGTMRHCILLVLGMG